MYIREDGSPFEGMSIASNSMKFDQDEIQAFHQPDTESSVFYPTKPRQIQDRERAIEHHYLCFQYRTKELPNGQRMSRTVGACTASRHLSIRWCGFLQKNTMSRWKADQV